MRIPCLKFLLIPAIASLFIVSIAASPVSGFAIAEKRLATVPEGVDIATVRSSVDGAHIAYPVNREGGYSVVLDGKPGLVYDKIEEIDFVEGGKLLRYIAFSGEKSFFIYGSKRSGPWDEVKTPRFWNGAILNPAIFVGKKDSKYSLVLNGTPGPLFDEITAIVASTGGESFAYAGRTGDAYSVLWNGKHFDYAAKVDSLVLTNFGRTLHLAWLLHEENGQTLVVDGIRGRMYDEISSVMAYDAIGAMKPLYGYEAKSGGTWRYVAGSAETPAFDQIMLDTLVLSPEGAFLAYAGLTKGEWYVYRGAAREGPYMDVYSALLLPDGKTIAYFAVDRDDEILAVVDGVPSEGFDNVGFFSDLTAFQAPGRWAIAGKKDGRWYVFSGAPRNGPYDNVSQIAFGSDGTLLTVSRSGALRYVDEADRRYGPYDDAELLRIGPDGGYLGFGGTTAAVLTKSAGTYSIRFGSDSTSTYDRVFFHKGEAAGVFRFFGIRGREVWMGVVTRK